MPQQVDPSEPKRVAQAVRALGVTHTVITSVTRDDLQDGGASIFAETIQRLKRYPEKIIVEILVPDFGGSREALNSVLAAGPDILAHNLETVPRLYPLIRPQADFQRSIGLLLEAKKFRSGITTKTGIMVGLGETEAELISVIDQIAETGIDILTIGQYLQPTLRHLPVSRYYHPSEFDRLREKAIRKGIPRVYSGPLVRSSRV
jgi:lipoic acid synthetase